jgi:hypothetical protein
VPVATFSSACPPFFYPALPCPPLVLLSNGCYRLSPSYSAYNPLLAVCPSCLPFFLPFLPSFLPFSGPSSFRPGLLLFPSSFSSNPVPHPFPHLSKSPKKTLCRNIPPCPARFLLLMIPCSSRSYRWCLSYGGAKRSMNKSSTSSLEFGSCRHRPAFNPPSMGMESHHGEGRGLS